MKKAQVLVLCSFFIGVLAVVSGCTDTDQPKSKKTTEQPAKKEIRSIPSSTAEFERIVGWISNNTVLLQSRQNGQTRFSRYNIYSGKTKLLYTTTDTISEVKISPDYKDFLIYSSSSKTVASIKVLSLKDGVKVSERKTRPLTANFFWNEESPERIMMILYDENWQFQTFNWNYLTGTFENVHSSSPLISWYSDHLFVVNRKISRDSERGDLYLEDTRQKEGKSLIVANILQFAVKNNVLITIKRAEKSNEIEYDFKSIGFQNFYSYSQPREYDELGTFIPYFDTNFSRQSFLVFEPYTSRKLSSQENEYKLIFIDPQTKKKEKVLDLIGNQPILSSPDHKLALYGFQFDKIISLKEKRLINLVSKSDRSF